ncbi:MAG: hypothetical protein LBD78_07450 [Spirochaetaceae bacterium]|jgi:hypothetical protein|nr:hypothetical protein [Spirochaetaceae bacterium]
MQKKDSSIASFIIALLCIIVYIVAILFAAYRMYQSVEERQAAAEREFFDLADLASSAGVLGFMGPAFQEAIQDTIDSSATLQGVIISGPTGEFAFERTGVRESIVNWVGDSARFRSRFAISAQPLFTPLRIEGLRNVTIKAVFLYINYDFFILILKQTLLIILAALAVALFTLILESILRKKPVFQETAHGKAPEAAPVKDEELLFDEDLILPHAEEEPKPAAVPPDTPQGLYSPRSGIGWEAYTMERLAAELHRCASFEQDLSILVMEYRLLSFSGEGAEDIYKQFADLAVSSFNLRDLIFERGERGIVVIIPNIDPDQGMVKAEDFHNRIPPSIATRADLRIGVSSRAGRLVSSERLLFEASEALKRAMKDPLSPIIVFKSDPEKYRTFIQKKGAAR